MAHPTMRFAHEAEHKAFERAATAYSRGDYAVALEELLPLIAAYPGSADLLHAAARCYIHLNAVDDAEQYAAALTALGDNRAQALADQIGRLKQLHPIESSDWLRGALYFVLALAFVFLSIFLAMPELFLERTLVFPGTKSAGELTGVQAVPFAGDGALDLGEALGEVTVPRGVNVHLRADSNPDLDKLPRATTDWIRGITIDTPRDTDLLAVVQWPRLEQLTLTNASELSTNALQALSEASLLKSLHLERASLSETALAAIKELKDLAHLSLVHCPGIRGDDLGKLAELPRLFHLELTLPQLGDDDLGALKAFQRLKSLRLAESVVSDLGLREVLPQLSISKLVLSDNAKIGDGGLAAISEMPRLENLELVGGSHSPAGLDQLRSLKSLRTLKVFCGEPKPKRNKNTLKTFTT